MFHKSHVRIVALLVSMAIVAAGGIARADEGNEVRYKSPRLADLAARLRSDDAKANQETMDSFWRDMQGRAPLIESIADDPRSSWITFLWRGDDKTKSVGVLGGPNTAEITAGLARLKNTDLWYRTDRVPNEARFVYEFVINLPTNLSEDPKAEEAFWKQNPARTDPLNRTSLAELPDAPSEPWLKRVPGVSSAISSVFEKALPARQVDELKIKSEILKEERTYGLYLPPTYDPNGEPCRLLVMFDGNGCNHARGNPFPVPVILDNLIADKTIPPLAAVFVFQSDSRNKELACSEAFADFIAKELVPKVQSDYNVSEVPEHTIVSGLSLGGLMSAYCSFRHPGVFGNVLSLSGSYQWCPGMFERTMAADAEPGWLTREFATSKKAPVRFYIAAGRFENFFPYSLLGENRRLRDVLRAKSYSVDYREFSGGHHPVCWRGPFVEGLIALAGSQTPGP
jgi:enterochelin esterase family protein